MKMKKKDFPEIFIMKNEDFRFDIYEFISFRKKLLKFVIIISFSFSLTANYVILFTKLY